MRAPVVSGKDSPLSGRTRSRIPSPVSSAPRAAGRTDPAAHCTPTKPSIDPSASTIARSPALAELGGWARTTVACTNGTRDRVSCSMRSESWVLTASYLLDRRGGPALHRGPDARRGEGHVGVPDAVGLQSIQDRVDDGGGRPDGRGLTDPLGPDRVVRGGRDRVPGLPVRDLQRRRDQVVH